MENEKEISVSRGEVGVPPSGSGSAVVPSRDATPSGTSDPSRGVERPILMSAPMVRATLAGLKTQTRRPMSPQPKWVGVPETHGGGGFWAWQRNRANMEIHESEWPRFCPYGKPGDRLWVRETWAPFIRGDGGRGWVDLVRFRADGAEMQIEDNEDLDRLSEKGYHWRPSIHMPRWASRITLEVVSVRVERLQDISEEDARAEGLTCLSKDGGITYKWGIPDRDGLPGNDDDGWPWHEWTLTAKEAFLKLFARIYGQEVADANPWLWAVSYRDRDAEGLRPKDRANSEPVAARADEGGIAHTNT